MMSHRRRRGLVALASGILVALLAGSALAEETKPVIGKPVTVPAQPQAGKRFTISFKVTRGASGAPLTGARMTADPSVSGQAIRHVESFRGGTARLSFVVPSNAAGKVLKVKLTIKAGSQSATKVATFRVQGPPTPKLSIGDVSDVEGSAGTTTLSFPVTLSAASTRVVTVAYASADATATAPLDYAAASGTLTFQPGEMTKTIPVGVVADLLIEQDETFTVTISGATNAVVADGSATGTISNDDTSVPITPGDYKGATQEGNYVFFTLRSDRTITQFRINDLPATCSPPNLRLTGGENFGDSVFRVRDDGTFLAEGDWTGSQVSGDVEWTSWSVRITGAFGTTTSVTGTITENWGLKYKGAPYTCTTGEKKWSATLQG